MSDLWCLIEDVKEWGIKHNINNAKNQLLKCHEELSEVYQAITRSEGSTAVKMELGDSFITLILLADILEYDLEECLDLAYNKISHREGQTVEGNFIKEDDLVNHPAHYKIDGRKECFEEMLDKFSVEEVIAFCELNSYKYRYRAGLKGDTDTDIKKAEWYENKADELSGNNSKVKKEE